MPDVDWDAVAEAVDRLSRGNDTASDALLFHAAARWGLEAQQRGERVQWCAAHLMGDTWKDVTRCCGKASHPASYPKACRISEHLLVPLEGEQ